jgi:hypothetical protein
MGEAELQERSGELIIRSIFCFYGEGASSPMAEQIAKEIEDHWNEPEAAVNIQKKKYNIRFEIKGYSDPALKPETVWYNDDTKLNFFRIEKYVTGNISFVDGIGSNTGYFKLDNLTQTSTTAAHEYGHTIGLPHPDIADIRGGIEAGIMYPRGTLCDTHLQYDPLALAAAHGGFLDPRNRKVCLNDIQNLRLHKLAFNEHRIAKLGEFTSIYHDKDVEGFVGIP